MRFVVVEPNNQFNGVIKDDVMYIGADTLESGKFAGTLVHEYTHFEEGSAEYDKLKKHLLEDRELYESAVANVVGDNAGYGVSVKDINTISEKAERGEQLTAEEARIADTATSEITAHMSEAMLGSEAFIDKLVKNDGSLVEKLFERFKRLKESLSSIGNSEARAELSRIRKAERLYLKAAEKAGNKELTRRLRGYIDEDKEANSQTSENLDAEGVDIEGEIQYNKKRQKLKFKFQHNNFPPENERQSEAHRLAVWWARRSDIETGDQTLISMNDTWYLVEKFDDALNNYQVEDKISQSEFDAIFKEIKENGRSGKIESIQTTFDVYDQFHKSSDSFESGKSGVDSSETRHGEKNSTLVRMASSENNRRERSSSDGRGDSQSRGTNREGVKYSLKKKQVEALESRGVKGDALLDAIDLADEILAVNGEITDDSKAVLYHATSAENAKKIIAKGEMYGKEDAIFFSTKNDGEISGYGDTVIEAKIPLEKLTLNDVFSNEVHVTMSVKPYVMTNIRYSRKKSSDTITMSRGEATKRNADYENEKVYSKKEVADALNSIPGMDRLSSKSVLNELVETVWKAINSPSVSRKDLFLELNSNRIFYTLSQNTYTSEDAESSVLDDMSSDEVAELERKIADTLKKLVEKGGSPSKLTKMREELKKEQGDQEKEARYWKDKHDEALKRNKLLNSALNNAQKMKDLKLGTFLNASQYKSDIFKDSSYGRGRR